MKSQRWIALFLVFTCACGGMQKDWEKALKLDTPDRYVKFRKDHPENPYNAQIEEALERLAYQQAKSEDTEAALLNFIEAYPNSVYVPSCKSRIEELAFQACAALETVECYEHFLRRFPRSLFVNQALRRLDPLLFHTAEQKQTEGAYLAYLERFPNGQYVEPATDGLIHLRMKALERKATIQDWEKLLTDYPSSQANRAVRRKREAQLTTVIDQFVDLEEAVLRRDGRDLTPAWNIVLASDAAFCNRSTIFYELNWTLHDRFGEVAGDHRLAVAQDVKCPASNASYVPIPQPLPEAEKFRAIRTLLDEVSNDNASSPTETKAIVDRVNAYTHPDDFNEWSSEYWMVLGIAKMKHYFMVCKDSGDPRSSLFASNADSGERELLLAIRLDPQDDEPYMYLGLFYEVRGYLLAGRTSGQFHLASMAVKAVIGTESTEPIPSGLLEDLPPESLLCLKLASIIWRENSRLEPMFRANLISEAIGTLRDLMSD